MCNQKQIAEIDGNVEIQIHLCISVFGTFKFNIQNKQRTEILSWSALNSF